MKLICFTHAGGNAAFFDIIKPELGGIEVVALEYAGHGSRHREQCFNSIETLADDLLFKFKDYFNGDYAFFGYSMGSIVMVEALKRITERGFKEPIHVFLAAHEPHTKYELLDYSEEEQDEWVKKRTVEFGAVPERLLNNKVYWRTYLPLLRADYTLIAKYDFANLGLRTNIPVSIFYSETDTPRADMNLWKNYFVGECDYYCFEGNHFFINQHYEEIAEIINEKLISH